MIVGFPSHRCNYLNRISGPLLDRIDLHIEVPAESSALIRERVVAARARQQHRFRGRANVPCNAAMTTRDIKAHCAIDAFSMELLRVAMADMNLSARAFDRILKVARTLADLAGLEKIQPDQVAEAIQFRSLDRQLWA